MRSLKAIRRGADDLDSALVTLDLHSPVPFLQAPRVAPVAAPVRARLVLTRAAVRATSQ
jgi:hypothetical protein